MLNWASRFSIFSFLDNAYYSNGSSKFDCLLAAGDKDSISFTGSNGFNLLQKFSDQHKDWLFGHFGYEALSEINIDPVLLHNEVDFGNGFFFVPQIVVQFKEGLLFIETDEENPSDIFHQIENESAFINQPQKSVVNFTNGITAESYKERLTAIKKHILRGDCYELNFCQSFFANDVCIDPLFFYSRLAEISPNPFGAFYKLKDKYCLCASPERFLKKQGEDIISQPIKGTSKRDLSDLNIDEANRQYLQNSSKEKIENVMVVDLVRNDLSRICREGTVHVKELFGIYSFPQVHQMISTVAGKLQYGIQWTDAIKACFPMGSMTGAPKIRVMELINEYEETPRGLFSGSIGYVDPSSDFDFNVVIRSLMYDDTKKLITFKAGGGITFNSDIEEEYKESLLKAGAIISLLKNN